MVFSRPGTHPGYVIILFHSKKVIVFKTNVKNCIELIDKLKQNIKYQPKTLKILYEKALKADQEQQHKQQ